MITPRRSRPHAETALLPAPFWCTKRVEPAHFDWHWRERPALALLAWEACSRSADEATPRPRGVNWKRQLILGQWLSPIATSQHRPVLDEHIALTFDLTSTRLVAFAPIAQSEPCNSAAISAVGVLSCPRTSAMPKNTPITARHIRLSISITSASRTTGWASMPGAPSASGATHSHQLVRGTSWEHSD